MFGLRQAHDRRRFLFLAALLALPIGPGRASAADGASDPTVDREILALRELVRVAAKAVDRAVLSNLYDPNFTHVRENGRVDDKATRIDLLVSGEATIETADEDELTIQSYGATTAAALGTSRIKEPATGRLVPYRWLAVYVRRPGTWQVVLSQASRIPAESR